MRMRCSQHSQSNEHTTSLGDYTSAQSYGAFRWHMANTSESRFLKKKKKLVLLSIVDRKYSYNINLSLA